MRKLTPSQGHSLKTSKSIVLITLVALLLTACGLKVVQGSGNMVTEPRDVSGFNRVSLSGSGEVIITQGGEESLTIETDDNIMEYVTAEVRGGTLFLDMDTQGVNLLAPTKLIFTLGVKDLVGLSISGSADIEATDLDTGRLDLEISGLEISRSAR